MTEWHLVMKKESMMVLEMALQLGRHWARQLVTMLEVRLVLM